MSPPDLLSANPFPLSQQLRSEVDHTLATIVKANHNTQFALIASELAAFRDATPSGVDGMDDATLCKLFRGTVQLTTYDAYSPLVERFFEKPCRESSVVNLFAPGLPDFMSWSSSTSGGIPKKIPRYNRSFRSGLLPSAESPARSLAVPRRTTAHIYSTQLVSLDIVDESDHLVKRVYVGSSSAVGQRWIRGLHPEQDGSRMSTFCMLQRIQPACYTYLLFSSTRQYRTVCRRVYKEMALLPSHSGTIRTR